MPKPIIAPLIIGAGGVTSYMLPPLLRSFHIDYGIIIDEDILEARNLDRQLFESKHVGYYKTSAIIMKNRCGKQFKGINEFFMADTYDRHSSKLMYCNYFLVAVDNHPARLAALNTADELDIPCIIGANEYETSQAMYYDPTLKDTQMDPRVRYPELLTDKAGDPTHNCTGDEAIAATPQLALANMTTACLMLNLLWKNETLEEDLYRPIEYQTTLGKTETLLRKDFL